MLSASIGLHSKVQTSRSSSATRLCNIYFRVWCIIIMSIIFATSQNHLLRVPTTNRFTAFEAATRCIQNVYPINSICALANKITDANFSETPYIQRSFPLPVQQHVDRTIIEIVTSYLSIHNSMSSFSPPVFEILN